VRENVYTSSGLLVREQKGCASLMCSSCSAHHVRILESEVHVIGEMHARYDGDVVSGDRQLFREARRMK